MEGPWGKGAGGPAGGPTGQHIGITSESQRSPDSLALGTPPAESPGLPHRLLLLLLPPLPPSAVPADSPGATHPRPLGHPSRRSTAGENALSGEGGKQAPLDGRFVDPAGGLC